MKKALFALMLLLSIKIQAQVGIGTTTPDATAQLDVSSTSRGFLPPRMTFAQREKITNPIAAGLIVWCTDCGQTGEMQVYDGSSWKGISLVTATQPPPVTGNSIVISQVYGAGGNTGATFNVDFVELFNNSKTTQSLSGLSIQQASATGTTWSVGAFLSSASIPPGGYFLIQFGNTPGATGSAIPSPDATFGNIQLGADKGKVALVNGTAALPMEACPTTNVLDFVGYGSTANCFEGSGPTLSPSAITALFRNNNGCSDTGNNLADFTLALPAPRNSSTTPFVCP